LAVVVFIIISIAAIFTISSVFVNIFLSKSSSHRSTKLSSHNPGLVPGSYSITVPNQTSSGHLYFAPPPTPSTSRSG